MAAGVEGVDPAAPTAVDPATRGPGPRLPPVRRPRRSCRRRRWVAAREKPGRAGGGAAVQEVGPTNRRVDRRLLFLRAREWNLEAHAKCEPK